MIEIKKGTNEELIIKILQKKYPVTINNLQKELKLSRDIIERVLKKLQVKGIVRLEPLPDKTFIRLLRNDFSFIGRKRQRKFIKHNKNRKKPKSKEQKNNDIMYS